MAKRRVCLLSLLSALLLFTQQIAVTHALWHQANAKARGAASLLGERQTPQSDSRKASALCDFDAMLGQLLTGGATASCAPVLATAGSQSPIPETAHLPALALLQPRSRGPPLIR